MIGQQISHFYIIRSLGSGGMGIVYEAQDTRLPRSVAIKFLKPALVKDVDAIRRFKREARLASSLNHPNICTVLDVDEGGGQGHSFIAMELLHGRSLKSRLAAGRLLLDEAVAIAIQVSDALAAAHDHGIMHRDITPGNIFIVDGGTVKILDFGLAKHFPSADPADDCTDDLTMPGAVAGTIHYMAPERLALDAEVDYRCDLFSLGAVLYHMITGARPFEASSRAEVSALIQEQPHTPARHLVPHMPESLERIIDKLLSKRPGDRYQTAWALRGELDLSRRVRGPAASVPRARAAGTSVAVLPFEIVGSGFATSAAFRDGLAEDISSRLSQVPDLRMAPRTSTRLIAGASIREIGTKLSVQMVLEGTVQCAGERVRVTANLIEAADERLLLPTARADRQFQDVLSTQDEIAREIVDHLASFLASPPGSAYTVDPEAYHALKRGQHHWKTCLTGGWRRAIGEYQRAVERDPHFALAHAALANAYNFLGHYGLMKPSLAFSVARDCTERALDADDRLVAAHVEVGLTKLGGDWDWEGAERAFRHALHLDPSNALAHVYYSWLLILLGREDAAFAEALAGHSLAPSSRLVAIARANTLYVARRYEDALAVCSACLKRDPDYVFAIHMRGLCHLLKSMYQEAIVDLEHAALLTARAPFYLGILGRCYAECGMHDRAAVLIDELNHASRHTYVPPQCYVYIYAGMGAREKALEYQERAYEDGASPFNYLSPSIRDLYALDPRHKKRLEQMRLTL